MTPISLSRKNCDVVKFFAAMLVLTGHMASYAINGGATHLVFYATATQNGYIGVAIFFFLSGYGLMRSEMHTHLTPLGFFRRRFCKVYLPVLIATVLWLPIWYQFTPPQSTHCVSIVYDLMWGFPDAAMWYIRVLVILYAGFYVTSLVAQKTKHAYTIFALACIAYSLFSIIHYNSIRDHSIPMFALGVLAAKYADKGVKVFATITLYIGVIIATTDYLNTQLSPGFIHVIFDYILIIVLVAWLSRKKSDWKFPAILAALSFDIYLVHMKLLEVGSHFWDVAGMLVFAAVAVFPVAFLFQKLRNFIIDKTI